MRKRILAVLLAAAMCVLLLAGCSDSGSAGINGGNGNQTSSSGSASVKLLGASWYRSGSYINQTYAVEVTNNNKNKAISLAQLTVTVKDAEDRIVKTDTSYTGTIAAGDTVRYVGYCMFQGGEPSKISVSISTPSYGYVDNSTAIYSSELSVSNVNYIPGQYYSRVTGQVTNSSKNDASMVRVSIIFKKNGTVLGGTYSYITNVNAGSTVPFEVMIDESGIDFDTYQVTAIDW